MAGSLRRAAVVLMTAALALIAAGSAFASRTDPFDGPAAGSRALNPQALLTDLFALGTDTSTIGVDSSELSTVGPQSTPTATNGTNMFIVDNTPLDGDCPNANEVSIQQAVNDAPPGSMIKVCPGTYVEQVTIPAGKDNLTLFSEGFLQAVIQAPPVMTSPKAIVRVEGAQNVTIRHFTITGPGAGPCDSLEFGVRVDSGGSAVITDNHITHIRDTPFSGCQNGVGVIIGRDHDNTFGSGSVVHNLIDDYQKGGVVVDGQLAPNGPSSHADVAYNEIVGIGPTAVIAQNGIQVSRGASGDIHHNVIHDNIYSFPLTAIDEALLIYQAGSSNLSIHHNHVYNNNEGIGLITTLNADVSYNYSHDNVDGDGLFADADTAGNQITHNRLMNNALFDCEDDSAGPGTGGTANFWIQDMGLTQNRPGLCKRATP